MNCQKCNSERIASISGKCSDCCHCSIGDRDDEGYVPYDLGVGGGDYIKFKWCLDCGQIQGNFPCPSSDIEKDITDEEIVEFFNKEFTEGYRIVHSMEHCYVIGAVAKKIYPQFGKFVERFLINNSGHYPSLVFPSSAVFLKMYREGQTNLRNL
jgi:hypothetical protein